VKGLLTFKNHAVATKKAILAWFWTNRIRICKQSIYEFQNIEKQKQL
jgi:hypothetical protein